MRKQIFSILLVFVLISISSCVPTDNELPYLLNLGIYGFDEVIITNTITKKIKQKEFDEIFSNLDEFKEWEYLLGFQIVITENNENYYKINNRYFILNDGTFYELISDNKLRFSFPCNSNNNVEIILSWKKTYG